MWEDRGEVVGERHQMAEEMRLAAEQRGTRLQGWRTGLKAVGERVQWGLAQ